MASFVFSLLKEVFTGSFRAKAGALLLKPYLKALRDKIDYRQYGGAPLLGVNGAVIIAHGSSDALAISNAIKVARETVKSKLVDEIQKEINQGGEIDE